MTHTSIDWTHKAVKIVDIRKLNKLYVIRISLMSDHDRSKGVEPIENTSLFVKDTIFEERIKSYFLKNINEISRKEILEVKWNLYCTQGYYIKINEHGEIEKFDHDPEKWYVSYLEIDGPLGTFSSVYRDKEVNKQ